MAIGIIVGVVVIGVIVFFASGLWGILTIHEREFTVKRTWVDPAAGDAGSHYLVYGTSGEIVELERFWWDWGNNLDRLLQQIEDNKGKKVAFECMGIVFDGWHWYSNCYKIKGVTQ